MATRTPKGPVAAATPKKVPAKPASVPTADKPVAAVTSAPVKAEPAPVKPAPVKKVSPPVAKTAPVPVAEPVKAPVAHAVEEVKAVPPPPEVVPTPVASAPVVEPPVTRPGAAFPPVPAAIPVAASIPVPAEPVVNAIAQTKEKVEKMSKQVFASFEDVVGFQKDNVEAIVASSTILTKGFEALSKEIVAFTQAQYEQSVTTTKALFAVKSVKELVDLQTEYAKTSFDALVAEATKVSEAGFKLTNEAAEPITARVNATVEKLSKLKAA
ncbi:TIGR01841 family phasin [Niveispirillum sp. KHB5.9]|uniref:phasin family protein n=1 Tax=Niveispirillum sp. KHB5.9 TaxID=3400269 RepID=UPI003A89C952